MVVGSILPYTGAQIPAGFLECDGTAVSRNTYSDLFSVIGTTYGNGDGSTTFNLPDFTGRVAVGLSDNNTLGGTGGEVTHTLTTDEIASHTHTVPSHTHSNTITATAPKLTHSITQPSTSYTKLNSNASRYGSGTSFGAYKNTTSAAMSRTNMSVSGHSAADCTMSGEVTDCAAFDTETAGSAEAHNNMMPYLSLTFVICYAS